MVTVAMETPSITSGLELTILIEKDSSGSTRPSAGMVMSRHCLVVEAEKERELFTLE